MINFFLNFLLVPSTFAVQSEYYLFLKTENFRSDYM